MAIIVNLKLSNQPEKREQAVNFFNRILPGTRSYDGCHWLYSTTNIKDKNKWEFFSMWDSKETYDVYLQWRVETGVMKKAEEFMDSEPLFSFSKIEKSY